MADSQAKGSVAPARTLAGMSGDSIRDRLMRLIRFRRQRPDQVGPSVETHGDAMSAGTTGPTFAGISLLGPIEAACSGAAFELLDEARESEVVSVDGQEAEVVEGERIIVVRGGQGENYDDAFRAGLVTAQKHST